MRVRTFIDYINNRVRAQVGVDNLTSLEKDLVQSFGEPLVEVGGNFTDTLTRPGDDDPTSVDFTLSTEQRQLPSQFPVVRFFDLADDSDADLHAKVFADEVVSRITVAKNELVANAAALEGETTVTI